MFLGYLSNLSGPRSILWCYLIWYLNVLVRYFDSSATLWATSLGLSAIIGTALYLSTAHGSKAPTPLGRWQIIRLYLMPFGVSSFASLIKGHGFILVFYPSITDNFVALLQCGAFFAVVSMARRLGHAKTA